MMRRALIIAGMAIFVFGCLWQFGRWLLRWSGYGLGLRSPPGGYDGLVDRLAEMIASRPSIGWIAGPWLLIGIGLMTLLVLRAWTDEKDLRGE
jgi:hypothetical protein